MSNADTVGAVFGLLLGLAAHNTPAIAAEAAPSGPVVAIDKARSAAAAESRRARETDAEAARLDGAASPQAPAEEARTDAAPAAVANVPAPGGAEQADVASAAAPAAGNERYDASRHRDPFRPPNLTATAGVDNGAPRTPLEAYEIGQLKLVGIVRDGGSIRAMVEDSAGLGYIVTTGTPIGSSGGVVRTIEQRRLLIEETTTNFYGEKQAKEVVMELPQEDRSP